MEEKATLLESLVEKTEDYTKTSIDLLKLKTIDKSAKALSSLGSTIIITIAIICLTTMVNIGVALLIGGLMGNLYYGFFIVAVFYLLVVIVLYVFRKSLLKVPLSNRIITNIRKDINI